MPEQKKDFSQASSALSVDTLHAGFIVTQVLPIPELSATAYIFRHIQSGARAMWIACADTNRSFAIAFKTPPADDTGVFHILEHSVLCGSDRFPVKEPFVNLLKTSMQTYLNALTFSDKTMYPVASTNIADLENLMDVYLDAVLHPAIYHRPRIFEQEGWHLELTDNHTTTDESTAASKNDSDAGKPGFANRRLIYNGVVFNEMKGALSDPDEVLLEGLNRALYPDSPYRFESGGDPRAIPTLTYEKFLDTHARHYNLMNSYTIFYGDLDIDRELAFVDKRFKGAAIRTSGFPNPLPLQAPIVAPLTRVEMATASQSASIGLAYVVGRSSQRERVLAADIVLDVLAGSNEAPLKRAVLDANLGDDFAAVLFDGILQPMIVFQLKGAKPGVADAFRTLVEKTCATLVTNGIETQRLDASLAQAEFNLREGDWGGYADGVALSMIALSSWLYDDNDPVSYLRYEEALAHMKEGMSNGYFEQLLNELVCNSKHFAEVELIAVASGAADEEQDELAIRMNAMSSDDLATIDAEVSALRIEQEAPDDPADLAKLPQLSIDDISDAPPETSMILDSTTPLFTFSHELDTHGIDYVWHYFDLRRLTADELPYAGILANLLGKLDTDHHRAAELDMLIERNLGSLSFFNEVYGRDYDRSYARPLLVVGASALSDRTHALATLPAEIWSQTHFEDSDRIRDILQQRRISLEQEFLGSGHSAAIARLSAHYSAASAAADRMSHVSFYLFLKDLLAHWDTRKKGLTETLNQLAQRIFTADEVIVSFAGPTDDLKRFFDSGDTLGLKLVGNKMCTHMLKLPVPDPMSFPVREAFTMPADVCFVAEGKADRTNNSCALGAWQVATRALSFDYLWNEVRVKGGAYGTGFRHLSGGLSQFWSYRDPGIDATIARFEQAGTWLANWQGTQSELEGYIVSTVAGHDTPLKPARLARRQDSEYFSERPLGWRRSIRKQELQTEASDLRALARNLIDLDEHRNVVVFGSADKVSSSKYRFLTTELFGMSDTES